MSIPADIAMDVAFHMDHAPTEQELKLVRAFRWNYITLDELWRKLGLRALYVCSHFGLLSCSKQAAPEGEPPGALDHVSTTDLLAELDRRSAT